MVVPKGAFALRSRLEVVIVSAPPFLSAIDFKAIKIPVATPATANSDAIPIINQTPAGVFRGPLRREAYSSLREALGKGFAISAIQGPVREMILR
jgi:hypothetical protein